MIGGAEPVPPNKNGDVLAGIAIFLPKTLAVC